MPKVILIPERTEKPEKTKTVPKVKAKPKKKTVAKKPKTKKPKAKKTTVIETTATVIPSDGQALPEESKTVPKQPKFYGKTKQAIKLVVEHGVDHKTALTMANNGKPLNRNTHMRFAEKVAKYSLASPPMVKKAHSVVRDILDGKTRDITTQKMSRSGEVIEIIETIAPTETNRLAAASMVFDRFEPIITKTANVNVNLFDEFKVDLSKYR